MAATLAGPLNSNVNHQMHKFSSKLKFIGSGLFGALILYALFFMVDAIKSGVGQVVTTSDVGDYESTIAANRNIYTAHFPRVIPSNARESSFFYQPAVMQGAARIQLRLVFLPEEIVRIRNDLGDRFGSRGFGNRRSNDSGDMMPRWISTGKFDTNMPADYEIFTIKRTPEDEWNHPKLSGIAISTKFSEVLYWYEDW